MTDEQLIFSISKIEDNFNKADISDNIDEIKNCVIEDWVLVDRQGGIIQQEGFFRLLEQCILPHEPMTKQILRVRCMAILLW